MWIERIAKCAIGAAGVAAIVASGGGGLGVTCGLGCFDTEPIIPPAQVTGVSITPRQTVQVGMPAVFKASAAMTGFGSPTYTWCRTPPAGGACSAISGAVESTLTIASPNLPDDGARFTVTVTASNTSKSATSQLLVSSMAGVVFADGEFVDAEWNTAAIIQPPDLPSTYAAIRMTDNGGNPGFYRKVINDVTWSGSVMVFHERPAATYDPGSQGEIRSIDFTIDCLLISRSWQADTLLLLSQGNRRYAAFVMNGTGDAGSCGGDLPPVIARWYSAPRPSVLRENFQLVDGPACGADESCPDFSASAQPLRLGMMTHAYVSGPRPPGDFTSHFEHGIDNWKVTVWRK